MRDLTHLDKRPSHGAASRQEIEKNLPSPEEQAKEAEYLERMFTDSKRAGAGGTKAGLVGIRPSGDITKFHERYTSPTKEKKQEAPFKPTDNPFARATVILPRNWCVYCAKMQDKPPVGANFIWFPDKLESASLSLQFGQNFDGPALAAACGIKPMEAIMAFVCKTCSDLSRKPGIPVVKDGEEIDTTELNRMDFRRNQYRHVLEFISAKRTSGDMSIYTDGRTE